jgi:hypothetical protein
MIASLLEGGGIAIGAMVLDRFLPAPKRRRKGYGKQKTICGCKHHHAFHNKETGKCAGLVRHFEIDGLMFVYDECGCQQYSGPEPVPEYVA